MSDKNETLIVLPTEVAQWHALINEAQIASSIHLNEELESYLVFLMMRFTQEPDMLSQPLATDMMEAFKLTGAHRQQALKEIGDRCLLLSGMFPGQAEKKMVGTDYFIEMGRIAYGLLAQASNEPLASLYGFLSQDFDLLADVLGSMRQVSGQSDMMLQVLSGAMPVENMATGEPEWTNDEGQAMVLFDIPPKIH